MDRSNRRSGLTEQSENGQEQATLKKRLMELDLYDEHMSLTSMRETIKFVDDSNPKKENNEILLAALDDSHNQLTDINNHQLPGSMRKLITRNSTSPEHHNDGYTNKSIEQIPGDSGSGLHSELCNSKNNDDTTQKYVLSPSPDREDNVTVRRASSSQDTKSPLHCDKKTERYSWNPLDCKQLVNDVPLKPRCLPPSRLRSFEIVNGIPIIPEEVLREKEAFLSKQADLWWSHNNNNNSNYNDFRWGSPIKVGIANLNLDRETKQDETTENTLAIAETSNSPVLTLRETGNSNYGLRVLAKKPSVFDFIQDDSDDEFEIMSKTKKSTKGPRKVRTTNKTSANQMKKKTNLKNNEDKEDDQVLMDDFIDDSDKKKNFPKSRKRAPTPEYPDDTPSRSKKLATINSRTKTLESRNPTLLTYSRTAKNSQDKKSDRTYTHPALSENEIEAQLISDDEDDIIPSSQRPSERLSKGVALLKKTQEHEDNLKRQQLEEHDLLSVKALREQEERLQKRIKENTAKLQQQEDQDNAKKKKEQTYRSTVIGTHHQSNSFIQKRTELESDSPRRISILCKTNTDTATCSPTSSANIEIEDTPVANSQCPICNLFFTQTEIENHADNCCEFQGQSQETNEQTTLSKNRDRSNNLPCKICHVFIPENDEQRANHFKECVQSLKGEGAHGANDWDTVMGTTSKQTLNEGIKNKKTSPRTYSRKRKH